MEVEGIRRLKEEVLEEIRGFMLKYNEAIAKVDEGSCKEIEILANADASENLKIRIKGFEGEIRKIGDSISEVERGKIIAPLVPVEDIIPGMNEEKVEELKKFYEEASAFLKSAEYLTGSNTVKTIKELAYRCADRLREEEFKRKQEEKYSEDAIKKAIMEPGNSEGVEVTSLHPVKGSEGRYEEEPTKMYTTKKIERLFNEYGIIPPCFKMESCEYEDSHNGCKFSVTRWSEHKFTEYSKCSLVGKQGCKEVEKKLEEILNSKDEKYDKQGMITFKVLPSALYKEREMKIAVTQRELAIAGILPETFRWTDRTIDSMEMATADKALGCGEKDFEPIEKSGFEKWLENVKNFFKGKGKEEK